MASPLRFFISSPGDVGHERLIASRVIERLQLEFKGRVVLQALLWEDQPAPATAAFQDYIAAAIPPAEADIVVGIFWKRLGSRLRQGFERRPDGTPYESGTVHELETALRAWEEHRKPTVIVYRKTEEPLTSLRDKGRQEIERQWDALESYLRKWFFYPDGTFRAGFHEFKTPEDFEQRLYVHLRNLVVAHLSEESGAGPAPAWDRGSPFRGLHPFEFEDAAIFFGRTRAVSEIRERFLQQAQRGAAFVLVHGMSGSGKSSVMRAGVLPTMTHPGVIEGVGLWRYCIFRPAAAEEDACAALARSLMAADVLPELTQTGVSADRLSALFERSPEEAAVPLRMALAFAANEQQRRDNLAEPPEPRLFLLIDQMEEIFSKPGEDEAERFMRLLAALATAQEGEGPPIVCIGATMRSDFLHKSGSLPGLDALMGEYGDYRLTPPNPREIGEIIRLSARAAGLRFERQDDPSGNGLDATIEEATLSDPATLPLLEFVLEELYRNRSPDGTLTFAAYRKLGGLEGALGERAEAVFEALPPKVQAQLPKVLRLLANPAQGVADRPTARTVSQAVFAEGSGERALIEAFLDPGARLLVAEGDGESARIRVAHEALLSHWPRARDQLAADRDRHRTLVRVETARAEWEARGKSDDFLLPPGAPLVEAADLLQAWPESVRDPEAGFIAASEQHDRTLREARVFRARMVAIAMTVLAVVAVAVGIFAYTNQRRAERNQGLATDLMDTLVTDVAARMETAEGIPAAFRESVLAGIERSFTEHRMTEEADPKLQRQRALALKALSTAYAALGRSEDALTRAKEAQGIMAALVASSKPDPRWRADLASVEVALGDTLVAVHDLDAAERAYDRAREIRKALSKLPGAPPERQRELATSEERLGDLYRMKNRFADARAAFERSRDERTALATKYPTNSAFLRDLSISHERLGDLLVVQRDLAAALAAFNAALKIRQSLLDADRANTALQLDVVVAHNKVGDVLELQEKPADAERSYQAGLDLIEPLVKQDEDNASWKRALAVGLYRIGDAMLAQRRLREARNAVARGIGIAVNLRRKDPNNRTWQRDLAMLFIKLGDVHAAGGRIENAIAAYLESQDISKQNRLTGSVDAAWQRDLAIGYERIGDMLRVKKRVPDAVAKYREADDIVARLVALDPGRADWRGDLAVIRFKLALALQEQRDTSGALKSVAASVAVDRELSAERPDNEKWRANLAAALNLQAWLLATLETGVAADQKEAVTLAGEAVGLTGGDNAEYVDTLAMAYFVSGSTDKAIELAEQALRACGRRKTSETDDACQEIASHLRRFNAQSLKLGNSP
jgi:tetratricopeptide (TPR) repeat protein